MIYDLTRVLLGLIFFIFGLNAFLKWKPLPKMSSAMTNFNEHMQATKVIMPVVKVFEVIFGLMLIINQLPFLAFLCLLPIIFFIVTAQLTFNRPRGYGMATVLSVFTLIQIMNHAPSWQLLFK